MLLINGPPPPPPPAENNVYYFLGWDGEGGGECVLFRSSFLEGLCFCLVMVGPPGFPSFEGVLLTPNSGLNSGPVRGRSGE